MISFDKIVKKMCEKQWKIITVDSLQKQYYTLDEKGKTQAYKLISRLKANNIILPIRAGVYFVRDAQAEHLVDIIDERYWSILVAIVSSENLSGKYFIGWETALRLHMKDFSLPTELLLLTNDTRKIIRITPDHSLRLAPSTGWKILRYASIYSRLQKFTQRIEIGGESIIVASRELALLEALSHGALSGETRGLVERFLKKYASTIDTEVLSKLVRLRYISALNRLRIIVRDLGLEKLYRATLDIIAREGNGCFLSEKELTLQK